MVCFARVAKDDAIVTASERKIRPRTTGPHTNYVVTTANRSVHSPIVRMVQKPKSLVIEKAEKDVSQVTDKKVSQGGIIGVRDDRTKKDSFDR